MGLFGGEPINKGKIAENKEEIKTKEESIEERIERIMKSHGLSEIAGKENQQSLKSSIYDLICIEDRIRKGMQVTKGDIVLIEQQKVIIEQNFVMIRLLDKILKGN